MPGGCLRLISLVSIATLSGKKILLSPDNKHRVGVTKMHAKKDSLFPPHLPKASMEDFEFWA